MTKNLFKMAALALLFAAHGGFAGALPVPLTADSLIAKSNALQTNASWSLAATLHSSSLYFFTGGVDQSDPAFDVLFVYERNGWGAIIYKSQDLLNHNTGVNYALAVINRHFYIGDKVQVTANVGVNLNQNYSVADKGSDLIVDLAVAYKLSERFKISNDAVFQNIGITKAYNWTNRLKLAYNIPNFHVAALLWDRNRVFNNTGYLSAGADFGYNGIKLAANVNLEAGASYIYMLQSDTQRKNGFMVSVGIDLGSK